jgi:hypothetical protein
LTRFSRVDDPIAAQHTTWHASGVASADVPFAELEDLGLTYFEDFFELTGNWPAWLRLVVVG